MNHSLICCICFFVQVYKLHRETLYLAVDFLDRYLGATRDMPRNRLQLVGITCLFVASKIEEIYPPKLREFAFVTDGACSEEEITHMELVVLKGLNWGLSPQTPNRWIKTYMQVNNLCTNLLALVNTKLSLSLFWVRRVTRNWLNIALALILPEILTSFDP